MKTYYFKKKNVLHAISKTYTDYDAVIFKKYLHIPRVYLGGILRRYPTDLQSVVPELSKLVEECHEYNWRAYKMAEQSKEEMIRAVQYKVAGVPPTYINRSEFPATSGTNLSVYKQIIDNAAGFAKLGRVLYFYSTFEENAMLAVANIIKAGIDSKLNCYMLPLASFMEEVKTFEDSRVLKKMDEAAIASLTMVASVYKAQSGFTEATMSNFVDQRRVAGKSTILSSHLNPEEFRERYGIDLGRFGAISMKFEDSNTTTTVSQLGKELAALKAS